MIGFFKLLQEFPSGYFVLQRCDLDMGGAWWRKNEETGDVGEGDDPRRDDRVGEQELEHVDDLRMVPLHAKNGTMPTHPCQYGHGGRHTGLRVPD